MMARMMKARGRAESTGSSAKKPTQGTAPMFGRASALTTPVWPKTGSPAFMGQAVRCR